ncbi:MAG: hypothetical protein KDK02_17120 [Rhodobacteraceae bacterium]|nr:hypothetical protein [Paracoccaceae bacterium]
MSKLSQRQKIYTAVHAVLGDDRVRSIEWREMENDNGLRLLRVCVVYDGCRSPSQSEMDEIVDQAWSSVLNDLDSIPIIDFQADTDNEFLAAE